MELRDKLPNKLSVIIGRFRQLPEVYTKWRTYIDHFSHGKYNEVYPINSRLATNKAINELVRN